MQRFLTLHCNRGVSSAILDPAKQTERPTERPLMLTSGEVIDPPSPRLWRCQGTNRFASAESALGLAMLISPKVIDAINEQIGNEFGASMQYVAIAAHFAADALPQLSQHFFRQAEEESEHAMRFIKYVVDAGGRVVIPAIDAPQATFKTAEAAIKLSLDQEVKVTHQINALVELARSENDYITINFLQWFLTEQLEEVSSMDSLLKIVQRGADNLLQVEEYLARVGLKPMSGPSKD